ncbi:NAD(P)-dependent oxidoreductase [Companilactobacillus metriopterae]|uniref:NAD(P)-dependent oxidoreductase n=1 Tax=Companilactobacillus metriopterae TaxID=1909267 RepID=UPI00100A76F6|nr:NAD(P)H-binding protein [Companilactobacillus metriopterae]
MKILVTEANRKMGQEIIKEALSRSIEVVGVALHPEKFTNEIEFIEKDIVNLTLEDIESFDVVINAVHFPKDAQQHIENTKHLINLLEQTQTRLIEIASPTNLYQDSTRKKQVADRLLFKFSNITKSEIESFQLLLNSYNFDWLYIALYSTLDSPLVDSIGKYVIGSDYVPKNHFAISFEDTAIMIVDQINNPSTNKSVISVWGVE